MSASRFSKAAMIAALKAHASDMEIQAKQKHGFIFNRRHGLAQCKGYADEAWFYYGRIDLCYDMIDNIEAGYIR